jgi:hypothetical protein
MHKDRGGPLVMGPIWDLNEAFGLCCGYPIEGEPVLKLCLCHDSVRLCAAKATVLCTVHARHARVCPVCDSSRSFSFLGLLDSLQASLRGTLVPSACSASSMSLHAVAGHQAGGKSNGTSGGSAISAAGWRFNICQDPGRCKVEPADGVSQWYRRLWQVRAAKGQILS